MSMYSKKIFLTLLITVAILFLDQVVKFLVKTNMEIGQEIPVFGSWFRIAFTENPGMAFGILPDIPFSKFILSFFRLIVVAYIFFLVFKFKLAKKVTTSFMVFLSLIMGGAIGNLIDNLFYGVLFTDSYGRVAEFLPKVDSTYGEFFSGRVVDMLWFPLITTKYPSWFPYYGGEEFLFFRPVFNIADSSITIGLSLLLLFHRKTLKSLEFSKKKKPIIEVA